MYKTISSRRDSFKFKRFGRKGYSLFACLGKEVLIGTLSVATLSHAKADSVSAETIKKDSVSVTGNKNVLLDEVNITGSRAPMTALQSAKIVSVITRDDINRAQAESVNDLLKMAIGVDVRQRGGFGVQTDISINGGTFDQITILLNGVNISNPQTGHNAADFPVNLSDIERIEVLEGASARVFGSSAFNGAINIITRSDSQSNVRLNVEGGSFGSIGGGASVAIAGKNVHNQLSGGYMRSDGGTDNSDFNKWHGYYQGDLVSRYLNLNWQVGVSSQNYGANTFYSAKYPNQYEETRRLIASVSGDIHNLPGGLVITPTVYWNRSTDHYQLIRGMEGAKAGENYHKDDVYGASLNAHISWALGTTAVGADIRKEHIYSTALGELMDSAQWKSIHGTDRMYNREGERTNTSIFLEHDVVLNKFTFSAGLLANKNTGLDNDFRFYPGIDISYRPDYHWKLYASWNKALRMPTFTDLYMSNVIQQGDTKLNPEKNDTYKIGARYRCKGIEAVISGFYSRGRDMIDWVFETSTSTKYHAMNIGTLNNMGYSADLTFNIPELISDNFYITKIKLGYAYIHQDHDTDQPIYKSLYALEYLKHKFIAEVDHKIFSNLSASWYLRWQQRMNGYNPYTKIDCKLQWTEPSYDLYVKMDNITSHRYYDLGNVLQPGFWIMVGGNLKLNL
jgi:iron complex outermembrane receptor protein